MKCEYTDGINITILIYFIRRLLVLLLLLHNMHAVFSYYFEIKGKYKTQKVFEYQAFYCYDALQPFVLI